MKKRFQTRSCAALVALAVLFPTTAGATEPAARHLRYIAYWGGLHAADFTLSLNNGGPEYVADFQLATQGFLEWLTRLRIDATSRGTESGKLSRPERYFVAYSSRRRDREVVIDFDTQTGLAEATVMDRKGSGKKEKYGGTDKMDPAMRKDVIDPLSALTATIAATRDRIENGGSDAFTLKVFDGRRRFDLAARITGREDRKSLGRTFDTYRVRLTTTPLAGFRKRHYTLWDNRSFDLFLRAGDLVPVVIHTIGTGLMMHLIDECPRPCTLEKASAAR